MIRNLILFLFIYFYTTTSFSQEEKMIDSLEKVVNGYKITNSKPSIKDSLKVNLLLEICLYQFYVDPDKNLKKAKEALKLSKEIHYKRGIAHSYFELGRAYSGKGEYLKALSYFNVTVKYCKKFRFIDILATTYRVIGANHLHIANLPESYKYSLAALKLHKELNDNYGIAADYNNFAIWYSKQNKYDKELELYKVALHYLKSEDSYNARKLKFTLFFNTTIGYIDSKQYDKSLEILNNFKEICNFKLDSIGIAQVHVSYGINYFFLKKYDKAIYNFQKASNIYKLKKDQGGLSYIDYYLGRIYLKNGNVTQGLLLLNKALEFNIHSGDLESTKFCYEELFDFYRRKKNYSKALDYHILIKKMNDSIVNSDVNSKILQLKMNFEFEQKQKEKDRVLRKKEEVLRLETEKQKNIKLLVFIGFLVVSIAAIGIYLNLKRNQKQNRIILKQKEIVESQNSIIQKSLQEKEVLLREIHHRVKNNLHIISSLLNIQSEDIKDQRILSTLNEGKRRVEAMSLIHQNLYQSEHISHIDMSNYLKELVYYLSQMYVDDSKNIAINFNIEKVVFDIDTSIPLGLIVNELVTNAFKYAFVGLEVGNIWISIIQSKDHSYELIVEDDGNGLSKDFDLNAIKSLGLSLVKMLTRQLHGDFIVHSTSKKTKFVIHFKDLKGH